jgi:hypothetical protein
MWCSRLELVVAGQEGRAALARSRRSSGVNLGLGIAWSWRGVRMTMFSIYAVVRFLRCSDRKLEGYRHSENI